MEMKNTAQVLASLPPIDSDAADSIYRDALRSLSRKIIVLDDDPTGIQTVHGISVYTDWSMESVTDGFQNGDPLFFILTNSRAMSAEETGAAHRKIAQTISSAANKCGKDYIIVSRSDSTLRGHYPLETQTLRETIEALEERPFDGEVICPFFPEGGRYTIGNIHYVDEGGRLVPTAETEFAGDATFGYRSSHLGKWVEEKSGGTYRAEDCIYIPVESLRSMDMDAVTRRLCSARDFQKIICNAASYDDLKLFCAALCGAMSAGKRFLFRVAASLVKILGGIADRPLLQRCDLIREGTTNGGLIVVGSHVDKTSRQLEALRQSGLPVEFLEFNQHLILDDEQMEVEIARVSAKAAQFIRDGVSVAIYTRREKLMLDSADGDRQLELSVMISEALCECVDRIAVVPGFIISKGGITSSDIGTKVLCVKKALVMGQVSPGIPVWLTGTESKSPGMPYVIFPGNVGADDTLAKVVKTLYA